MTPVELNNICTEFSSKDILFLNIVSCTGQSHFTTDAKKLQVIGTFQSFLRLLGEMLRQCDREIVCFSFGQAASVGIRFDLI